MSSNQDFPRRYLSKQSKLLLLDWGNNIEEYRPPLLALVNAHPRDKRIKFYDIVQLPNEDKPREHLYIVDGDPDSYISCTTFIHGFFSEFDADLVITRMMAGRNWESSPYFGKTREEIKDLWEVNRVQASSDGTKMHAQLEDYKNGIPVSIEFTLTKEWLYFNNYMLDHDNLVPFRTEWEMFDEEHFLAGSADMIYEDPDDKGALIIADWKRSKEIKWTAYTKGKPPLEHILDCNSRHYALQLNLYKYILEKNYGVRISKMFLLVLHPSADNYQRYDIEPMPKEIDAMLAVRKIQLAGKHTTATKHQLESPEEPNSKRLKSSDTQ